MDYATNENILRSSPFPLLATTVETSLFTFITMRFISKINRTHRGCYDCATRLGTITKVESIYTKEKYLIFVWNIVTRKIHPLQDKTWSKM